MLNENGASHKIEKNRGKLLTFSENWCIINFVA